MTNCLLNSGQQDSLSTKPNKHNQAWFSRAESCQEENSQVVLHMLD